MPSTAQHLLQFAVHLSAICLCSTSAGAQDYLLDSNVRIERHNKRTTRTEFPRENQKQPLNQWGLMFERTVEGSQVPEEANLIQYEKLAACEKPEVRLLDIHHHTPGTEATDVVFYADDDSEQRKRAAQYSGFKVAYRPALMRDPKTGQPEYWQSFARFIQLECLPARFHFTYVGSVRYIEYRLGQAAWEIPKAN